MAQRFWYELQNIHSNLLRTKFLRNFETLDDYHQIFAELKKNLETVLFWPFQDQTEMTFVTSTFEINLYILF